MTKHHPHSSVAAGGGGHHDYLPAAGRDIFLPCYDLLTRALGMNSAYDALIEQAELRDGQRLLEIGCGTGTVITRAQRRHRGVEAFGCDPDPRALIRARRKAGGSAGIRFDRGYAQDLPYADGQFDRVLSSMMWHHLDDEVKSQAAAEIFRVLRPGGRLHLLDVGGPMSTDDGRAARRMLRSARVAGNLGDGIPRLLRSAGFDCTQVDTHRQRLVGRLNYYRASRPS